MVTLYNVIDTRTGKHHSVAIISEEDAKYFEDAPVPTPKKTTKRSAKK